MKTKFYVLIVAVLYLMFYTSYLTQSQTTITVGSGVLEGKLIPIYPYAAYSYSQQIVLQSEIGTPGYITKLKFYMKGGQTIENSNAWTVYIGHTSKNDFTSTSDWISVLSLTQVYSGTISSVPDAGWYEIPFSSSYYYNNTQNLVIAMVETKSGVDQNNNYIRIWNTPTSNRAIYYNGSTSPNPSSPPVATGRLNYINQMQFDMITTQCSIEPEAGLALPATQSVYTGATATISISDFTTELGLTFQWQQSSYMAGPFVNVGSGTGANTPTYTTAPVSSDVMYYRCLVTCTNTGDSDFSSVAEVLKVVDVGVTDLVAPDYLTCSNVYTASEAVTVKIKNFGSVSVTNIPVVCEITGGLSLTLTQTYIGTILPGETKNFYIFNTC